MDVGWKGTYEMGWSIWGMGLEMVSEREKPTPIIISTEKGASCGLTVKMGGEEGRKPLN